MNFFPIFVAGRVGVSMLHVLSHMISKRFSPLATKSYTLTYEDTACLALNTITETMFLYWIYNLDLQAVSLFSPIGVIFMFIADDLLYAPYHHALHHKMLYQWIHHRHHKISHPSNSYVHASMEHPLEMIGALLLHAFLIKSFASFLDKTAVFLHVSLKAIGACLNHCGRDVHISLYSSKCHHLHHMYRKCNYAQYFFLYDVCIGTFVT